MRKVFVARRNADTNEGRGPMAPVLAFLNKDDANKFIDGKPGVQGICRNWSEEEYGHWDIQELVLILPGETVTKEALASNLSDHTVKYIEEYSK